MQLNTAQFAQFEEEGYLLLRGVLADADLDPIIAEYEHHIDLRHRSYWPRTNLRTLRRRTLQSPAGLDLPRMQRDLLESRHHALPWPGLLRISVQ